MIDCVIHLADIHIKYGDIEASRYNEYLRVFDNLEKQLEKDITKNTIIVVVGDILHYKSKIDKYGIRLFNRFMKIISKKTKVVIIGGNHDKGVEKEDIIGGLIEVFDNENVIYINETTNYKIDNVVFGVKLFNDEDMVIPENFVKPYEYKIMLYHGGINKAKMQNGQDIKSKVSLEMFNNYDFIMLGDIHLRQKGINWGYSGSLIQQNYGEPVIEHGYLIWNLREKTIIERNIYNDIGYFNIKDDGKKFLVRKDNLEDLVKKEGIPDKFKIMITTKERSEVKINDRLKKIIKGDIMIEKIIIEEKEEKKEKEVNDENIDIDKYMIDNLEEKEGKMWENIRKDKNKIYLNEEDYPESLKDNIKKINNDIDRIKFEEQKDKENMTKIKLIDMKWNWILCFGEKNYFNFENLKDNIVMIGGKNGSGKTSFFEVICLGLFGKQIMSRSSELLSIINLKSPKETGKIVINFMKNDIKYTLKRFFIPTSKGKSVQPKAELYKGEEQMCDKVTETNEWIKENIGTLETFLLNTMITQNSDLDFFSITGTEQMNMLGTVMNFDEIQVIEKGLNKMSSIYEHTIKSLNIYNEILSETINKPNNIEDVIKRIEEIKTIIEKNIKILKDKNKELNNIDINEFSRTDEEISEEIEVKEKNIVLGRKRDEIIEEIGKIKDEIDKLKGENINITDTKENIIKRLNELKKDVEKEHDKVEYYKEEHNEIIKELEKLEKDKNVRVFEKNNNIIRPTIEKEDIKKMEKSISEMKSKIDNISLYELSDKDIKKEYDEIIKEENKEKSDRSRRKERKNEIEKEIKENNMRIMKKGISKIPKKTKEEYEKFEKEYEELEETIIDDIKLLEKIKVNEENKIRRDEIRKRIEKIERKYKFEDKCESCRYNKKVLKGDLENELNKIVIENIEDIDEEEKKSKEERIVRWEKINRNVNEYNNVMEEWEEYEKNMKKIKKLKEINDKLEEELKNINEQDNENNKTEKKKKEIEYCMNTRDKCNEDEKMINEQKKRWNEYVIYEENRKKREKYDKLREEKEEMDKIKKENEEYKMWEEKKEEYNRLEKGLKMIMRNEKIKIRTKLEEELNKEEKSDKAKERINILKNVLKKREDYNNMRESEKIVDKSREEMLKIERERGKIEKENDERKKGKEERERAEKEMKKITRRMGIMKKITEVLRESHKDIYERYIIPKIEREVNKIVNKMTMNEIELKHELVEIQKATYKFGIKWMIKDRGVIVPINKASGFQRFIIGMGMRIGLTRIGVSSINCGILFIDEGFTSCDDGHMGQIGEFLNNIIDEGYCNKIILATHLEMVKENVDRIINVIQDHFIVRE